MPPADQLTTLSLEHPKPADSLGGHGVGDHDLLSRFGRQPRAIAIYPFSTRQFARLLVLRGKVAAGLIGAYDRALRPAMPIGRGWTPTEVCIIGSARSGL